MSVVLHGYRYSVYSWIARLALREKGVDYTWSEVDPFADSVPPDYLALHPFKRVPTLVHDEFALYETSAITRYIDETFAGPRLQPVDARVRARMNQILSIIDSYGYWPLVRQVFSHGAFRPRLGRPADVGELRQGLAASLRVLDALERLAGEGDFLLGDNLSLADIHLAPMISYFATPPQGVALLKAQPRLEAWWTRLSVRPSVRATAPELPS